MKKTIAILICSLMFSSLSFAVIDQPSIWAEDFIEELKAYDQIRSNAFEGYQDDITRAEFVYLTVKMIEIVTHETIEVDSSISFTDTNDIYALKGATIGITSGIGDGKFGPDMLLTREQMATLLLNTLDLMDMNTLINTDYKFVDDSEFSSWAKEAIYLVKANDIMSGVGNDKFNAAGKTSKEAALVVVTKLIRKNLHKLDNTFINNMNKTSLNVAVTVNDSIEVIMEKITVSEKPSINTLTFTYSQKNISNKDIPESSLRVFFSDGSSELIKGFSKYYSPGSTKIRTSSLDYSKLKTPLFVIIETSTIDINLNLPTMTKWIIEE
ncbi:MAG: S-layer homology domain-containing protein [Clostridiales bacterium]|nr:S-layer homology domain-containing protein [Clostridiales bacterium]